MLRIGSLKGIAVKQIAEVFNESFSDYYFSIRFSTVQLEEKFLSENVVLEWSVGAFVENKLVGFILHFFDDINGCKTIYNGGTGVVPSQRRQGVVVKMYEYILPILKLHSIDRLVHEVLSINAPAIHVYEKVGFKKLRYLDCFKGALVVEEQNTKWKVNLLKEYDWNHMQTFWDYPPTWQNSILTLNNLKEKTIGLGVYWDDILLGYLIYKPEGNRIHQLAVHKAYRNQGIATILLKKLANRTKGNSISIINIDKRLVAMSGLLEKYGLICFLEQFEMEKHL